RHDRARAADAADLDDGVPRAGSGRRLRPAHGRTDSVPGDRAAGGHASARARRRAARKIRAPRSHEEGMTMIGIVGGGLSAAKLVESYRKAGGGDDIIMWSSDPHGPYHRPPLSKRLLRGEDGPEDALVHPIPWYVEHGVDLRLGDTVPSLDQIKADTFVIAT